MHLPSGVARTCNTAQSLEVSFGLSLQKRTSRRRSSLRVGTASQPSEADCPPNTGAFSSLCKKSFFFFFNGNMVDNCPLDFPGGSDGKASVSTMWETQVRFQGREDLLEKEMATHSSTLAWKIPRTEEAGRLQSIGSRRVRHD